MGRTSSVVLLALVVPFVLVTMGAEAQSRTRRPRRQSPRARIAELESQLADANARAETATASAATATSAAEAATERAERAERRATAAEAEARAANARAARAAARTNRGRRSDATPAPVEGEAPQGDALPTPARDAVADGAPPFVAPPSIAPPTNGRAIANLSSDACLAILRGNRVAFDVLDAEDAPGVETPVRLRGPLGGVTIAPRNDPQRSPHAIVDCRLAVALLTWAPTLRAARVNEIEHYSAYRANARIGGRGAVSGHASAMALDAARFHTDEGVVFDVLVDWADRTRGEAPCTPRDDEPPGSQLIRGVVCAAVHAELFQVVLTPHHDAAHQNHVHLELRPGVDWSFVK